MRVGRARWKIENETFNTLKNQGYHFEHNYGHGKQYLANTLGTLMLLAFLIDQSQELACRVFQQARKHQGSRRALWERMRALLTILYIPCWASFMDALANPMGKHGLTLQPPDTS